jgi:hypothetical protein
MSIIKDLYDLAKDGAALKAKAGAIKKALRTELKLNKKCLLDIEEGIKIGDDRRIEIINMLDIIELAAAVKYEIPYSAISRKKVTPEIASEFKIKRLEGADIEKLIEDLYLMTSYLKKDSRNKRISINLRLINIYKYNRVLIELLK